ncbi:CinA family protein [Ectothiorhodospira shaposhnikovii]|uniref:CinA family protein n=1 Tax=Ectothiorhodospira shaposhnikovii TaxID=1054 RepID=UPI001EE82EA3|nr:nicotinamide-nucleotide amidohydrolase family protein [Ectothiorhodospira shaposhnikovii]MCG5514439.1 nicotinamide-nucleotide amidohydrolase family protein [Ectothiorhodospira shaposhnikovii]
MMVPSDAELEALARRLGEQLRSHGETLVLAESCTGGWIAKVVTDLPGSSTWFDRGFVTYSNRAKIRQLGVDPGLIDAFGAVSEQTVTAMAIGALNHSDARLAVAVSGIAGPGGGAPDKPVGTLWLAWARPGRDVQVRHHCLAGDREAIRRQGVALALTGAIHCF